MTEHLPHPEGTHSSLTSKYHSNFYPTLVLLIFQLRVNGIRLFMYDHFYLALRELSILFLIGVQIFLSSSLHYYINTSPHIFTGWVAHKCFLNFFLMSLNYHCFFCCLEAFDIIPLGQLYFHCHWCGWSLLGEKHKAMS